MLKNRKIQLLILIVLLIIVTTFFIIKNVIYKPKAKNSKEQYNNIKSNNIETTNVVEKYTYWEYVIVYNGQIYNKKD